MWWRQLVSSLATPICIYMCLFLSRQGEEGERELANNDRHFECMSLTGRLSFLPNANGLMELVKTLQALWLYYVYREINCGPRSDASMT